MTAAKRLSAAFSVLGTALVMFACASPTDAELAGTEEASPTEADADEGKVDPTQATDLASSALSEDEDDTREIASGIVRDEFRGRRCDRRDDFHCRRHHRGWRWVRDYGRPNIGPAPGWGGGFRPGRDRYCCVQTFR